MKKIYMYIFGLFLVLLLLPQWNKTIHAKTVEADPFLSLLDQEVVPTQPPTIPFISEEEQTVISGPSIEADLQEPEEEELRSSPVYNLNVPIIAQRMDQWCWAASLEMLSKYVWNSSGKTQEQIVSFIKGSLVNDGAMDFEMTRALFYANNNHGEPYTSTSININATKNMIDVGQPFPLSMVYQRGGGHTVLAIGYNSITNLVLCNDPWDKGDSYYVSLDQIHFGVSIAGTPAHLSFVTFY